MFLCDDLFIAICNKLPNMNEVIKLVSLSSYYRKLIRNTTWNLYIKIQNNNVMDHIIKYYKLTNIHMLVNVDRYIDYIKYCDILTIDKCYINDLNIEKLHNVKILNMNCTPITDEGAIFLCNCYSLRLQYTKITDISVMLFGNIKILDLNGCKLITDNSVKLLGKCMTLILSGCNKITNEGVKYLSNVENLYLSTINNITDEGIKLFSDTKILSVRYTKVNGKYFKNLKCDEIYLSEYYLNNFKHLRKCKTIYAQQTNITQKEFEYLESKGCIVYNLYLKLSPYKKKPV